VARARQPSSTGAPGGLASSLRRIELYRRYLREGLSDAAVAAEYLRQIAEDEAALGRIERGSGWRR